MTREVMAPTPTMPALELEHRRTQLAALDRDELVARYLALPGSRRDRTLLSDKALVEVLAWSGPLPADTSRPIAFTGADGDLVE